MEHAHLRTPLARARGLGSAKDGVHHWWAQRLTAIALIPLVVWFAISLVMLSGADYAVVRAWIGSPLVMVLLILTIAVGLHHGQLGLQVVIEDYVDGDGWKLALIVIVKFIAAAFGLAAILAILHYPDSEAGPGRRGKQRQEQQRRGRHSQHRWPRLQSHRSQPRCDRRWRRGRRVARDARHDRGRAQDGVHHQGLPDAQPHRGGARRDQRGARQYGRGRLALAHVRHGQGVGLAGRPGRDRIHVPPGDPGGHRTRTFRRAVLAHRNGADLPAPVRRPHDGVRRGRAGQPRLRRRRPHRPRDHPHALPAVAEAQRRVLRRVFRPRPDHGRGGRLPRRHGVEPRGRHAASLPGIWWCWRPAATAAPISPAPRRIPAPATATRWCCAPGCRCRTWNSSSSTRPGSMAPAA